jgi:hypothetical protein
MEDLIWFTKNVMPPDWAEMDVSKNVEHFVGGIGALCIDWIGDAGWLMAPEVKYKVGIAPHPYGAFVNPTGIGIAKDCKNPIAAFKFLEYCSSKKAIPTMMKPGSTLLRQSGLEIPDLFKGTVFEDDDYGKLAFIENLKGKNTESTKTLPHIKDWSGWSEIVARRLTLILIGEVSIEKGLEDCDKEVESFLKEHGYYK